MLGAVRDAVGRKWKVRNATKSFAVKRRLTLLDKPAVAPDIFR